MNPRKKPSDALKESLPHSSKLACNVLILAGYDSIEAIRAAYIESDGAVFLKLPNFGHKSLKNLALDLGMTSEEQETQRKREYYQARLAFLIAQTHQVEEELKKLRRKPE